MFVRLGNDTAKIQKIADAANLYFHIYNIYNLHKTKGNCAW